VQKIVSDGKYFYIISCYTKSSVKYKFYTRVVKYELDEGSEDSGLRLKKVSGLLNYSLGFAI
jgi:hypothetical protein